MLFAAELPNFFHDERNYGVWALIGASSQRIYQAGFSVFLVCVVERLSDAIRV